MMNRIDETFRRLSLRGEKALIPFLVAGDPDMATTRELVLAVEESGADILEIGVPFSDPTSDGPVIQRSAQIALEAGCSLPRVLEMVAEVRRTSQLPIILYGYYNPIFRYGVERFAADAAAAGIDAVLVVDLPPEEVDELLPFLQANGIHFVFLLAPTSDASRVRKVLRKASGFLYYVSVTGVTGAAGLDPASVRPAIEALRPQTSLPIGVGFGIATPEQAAAVADFADAAVVGSAIMRVIDAHRGTDRVVSEVAAFVRRLKEGIRAGTAA